MEESSAPKSGMKGMEQDEQTAGLPYMCTICRKTFKTPSKMVIHMRSHSGEKPYTCNICEKGFTVQSSLTTLMRTQWRETLFLQYLSMIEDFSWPYIWGHMCRVSLLKWGHTVERNLTLAISARKDLPKVAHCYPIPTTIVNWLIHDEVISFS